MAKDGKDSTREAGSGIIGDVIPFSQALNSSSSSTPTGSNLISTQSFTLPESNGRIFYVNPSQSLQYAVSQLQAGDTLYLEEGVYDGAGVVFSRSGTAAAPIRIEGLGNVVIDGISRTNGALAADVLGDRQGFDEIRDALGNKSAYYNKAAFDTNGHNYLQFFNLTVKRMKTGVEVDPGSSYIEINGLHTDGNRFGVSIQDADHVIVRNAVIANSWNGIRIWGDSRDVLVEDTEIYGSFDVWSTMSNTYINGDGLICEATVGGTAGNDASDANIILRNVVSHDNADGGFDVKAKNVLMINVEAYGNKNNWKLWGENITILDSSSHDARSQYIGPNLGVEGNGVTMEVGATNVVLKNVVIYNNEGTDVRLYSPSELTIQDSVVSRKSGPGEQRHLLQVDSGASLTQFNVQWLLTSTGTPPPPSSPPPPPPSTTPPPSENLSKEERARISAEQKRLRDALNKLNKTQKQ